jgi:hypothetical protein
LNRDLRTFCSNDLFHCLGGSSPLVDGLLKLIFAVLPDCLSFVKNSTESVSSSTPIASAFAFVFDFQLICLTFAFTNNDFQFLTCSQVNCKNVTLLRRTGSKTSHLNFNYQARGTKIHHLESNPTNQSTETKLHRFCSRTICVGFCFHCSSDVLFFRLLLLNFNSVLNDKYYECFE